MINDEKQRNLPGEKPTMGSGQPREIQPAAYANPLGHPSY
jgi:hypothetical protein